MQNLKDLNEEYRLQSAECKVKQYHKKPENKECFWFYIFHFAFCIL